MKTSYFKSLAVILLAFVTLPGCGGGGGGGGSGPGTPLTLRSELIFSSPNFIVGLDVAPDGRIFFTELETGAVRILAETGLQAQPFVTLPVPTGTAQGLLGVSIDPDFEENHWVYVYVTTPHPLRNRAIRYREQNGAGVEPLLLIDNIPAGGHDGGKFAFDDEDHIFISTGDSDNPALSQQILSLAGKILRLNKDGSIPSDNPFPGSPVFSFGFRNVFGIAKDPRSGNLFVSENGPDCDDEINELIPGGNYGWRPGFPCGDTDPNFIQPIYRVSPSLGFTGITFYEGGVFPELRDSLLLADFNTGQIKRLRFDDNQPRLLLEEAVILPASGLPILDLKESPIGEILYTSTNGIFRLQR